MQHIERHHSQYAPAQLFDLVIDVDHYPGILPWVLAARVLRHNGSTMRCELTMGTSFLRLHFTTVAELARPHRVEINSYDPMFERFEQIWTLTPAAEGGTDIEYRVDIRCRSRILQALLETRFPERARTMVKAYLRWAQWRYGTPSLSDRATPSRPAHATPRNRPSAGGG
jgi:coenzyme Q-binding protein COQ10